MSDKIASRNPLPAASIMGPPIIPERRSSKRKAAEHIEELEAQRKKLSKAIKQSKQQLSRSSSYDAECVNLPEIERLILISELATGSPTARSLASRLPELNWKERYQFEALAILLLSNKKAGIKQKLRLIPSRKKAHSIRKNGCSSNRLNEWLLTVQAP